MEKHISNQRVMNLQKLQTLELSHLHPLSKGTLASWLRCTHCLGVQQPRKLPQTPNISQLTSSLRSNPQNIQALHHILSLHPGGLRALWVLQVVARWSLWANHRWQAFPQIGALKLKSVLQYLAFRFIFTYLLALSLQTRTSSTKQFQANWLRISRVGLIGNLPHYFRSIQRIPLTHELSYCLARWPR